MADVARRTGLSTPVIESLATAGAFRLFGLDRRRALWSAGMSPPSGVIGCRLGIGANRRHCPAMTPIEQTMADLWSTGISPTSYRPSICDPGWTGSGHPGRRVAARPRR